jgi:hypothetical protein
MGRVHHAPDVGAEGVERDRWYAGVLLGRAGVLGVEWSGWRERSRGGGRKRDDQEARCRAEFSNEHRTRQSFETGES